MSYFPDMSDYVYKSSCQQPTAHLINVGWLDSSAPYNKGNVDPALLQKLLNLCRRPVNRTRGWHVCPFCRICPITVPANDEVLHLGDAEIRVKAQNGKTFACPTLIYHYIQAHGYRPPDEFLEALKTDC